MKKLNIFSVFLTILMLFTSNSFAQDFPYISFFVGPVGNVRSVAFSPNGQVIASGSTDGVVRLQDASTGDPLQYLRSSSSWYYEVYAVVFSPDGQLLANAGSGLGDLCLWEVSTGELIWKRNADSDNWTADVAFSPDGKILASGGDDNIINLWEVSTGNKIRSMVGHTGNIDSVAFSPDGKTLASGSADKTIRFWDVNTGRHRLTLTGHSNSVYSVVFSPDGKTLASGSFDGTIRLWDANTGKHRLTLTGHTNNIYSVVFSPDGKTLASGGIDRTIRLWEVSTGKELHRLFGHGTPVRSVAFSPDGQTLASGHTDGVILLWDLPKTSVRLSPERFVSPDVDKQFSVNINIFDGEDIRTVEISLAFDPTALRFVSSEHGTYLPEPADGYYIAPVLSKNNSVVTLGATYIVSGSSRGDGTVFKATFEVLDTKDSFIDVVDIKLTNSEGIALHAIGHSAKIQAFIFGDVNRDGSVNIQDIVVVANNIGKAVSDDNRHTDVNNDGVVNIQDIVLVAGAFGNRLAPAAFNRIDTDVLTRTQVQKWLSEAQQLKMTDATSQRGILFLEQLLAALTPKETALLPNYPNPFNPETWLPYQLAEPADVRISIYAANGTVVQTLELGHQPVGIYQGKSHAAHWDGKNAIGEPVASGVYFYTLTAGDFTATRKMLIRK